ncbi:MAG: aminodeoxychorismate/anthranilate synthase component II [Dehalococcoidia bacterium]|nr:aminodeoxychorismate/anthranilate synthase component II [Dehalococcoidia bacterium]
MILIIDNYDSFVYNLAQYIGELGWEPEVYRNDAITIPEIEAMSPSHIVISPGPCTPREGGISNDVIRNFAGKTPLLGVCLGHQCIGYVYGGEIIRADVPVHGKTDRIFHDGKTIYQGLPLPFEAGRYHSLIIKPGTFQPVLEVSAENPAGQIMGVRHKEYVVEGVQFHPESIMTGEGHKLLENFLRYTKAVRGKNG